MFDELRDLYQDIIVERSRHPRHGARLAVFDATADGDNPMCGDRCRVYLRRDGESRLAEIGFEARGCAISVASADLMVEAVTGLSAGSVRTLAGKFEALVQTGASDDQSVQALRPMSGVSQYPSRIKCATLPWRALLAAMDGTTEATSE